MSEIRVNNLSNESLSGGPTISGITTFSSPYLFTPPVGDTGSRPQSCPPGSLRFNTDSAKLEYYRGNTIGWVEIEAELTAPLGGGTGSNTGLGTRMVLMGGTDGSGVVDVIQFITISTLGNAQDFGNLSSARQEGAAATNHLRGLYFGGDPSLNIIEFVTFSSLGNVTDFGDLLNGAKSGTSMSDRTRGVLQLGGPTANILEYVTFAQTGNAVDFGDMLTGGSAGSGFSSSTRGVYAIGSNSANYKNIIEFITISTTGNGTDFGDLSAALIHRNAYSNATRGVFHSGYQYPASPNFSNNIEYVTIASTGNTIDFGDSLLGGFGCGGSSPTRGVAGGGYFANSPTGEVGGFTNIIDFIEIATTGNAVDFGDTTNVVRHIKGGSNGHGGL
tara:strand:- start:32 stop:1195 length:1164 start_codon:yes stop_codon:yes gene_type:complete